MDAAKLIKQKRAEILEIAARNGASNVRIFGSVARGDATDGSDFDFLVDLEPHRSLLDIAGLTLDLEHLLNHKVDVVTARGLKPTIRDDVLNEAIAI